MKPRLILCLVSIAVLFVLGYAVANAASGKPSFTHPLTIDNRWTPLVPGYETVYTGNVREGSRTIPHRIVSIVTDLTKRVNRVSTAVVWERDFSAGRLAESELFFVAQDDTGNVWLFGEYPEIYNGGALKGAPDTWVAPVFGARPGIFMLAAPRVGTPSYSQGIARKIGFYDRARVLSANHSVCVPIRCFHHVLVIDEWSPLAPGDGHQRKYYAPGVGTVLVRPAGGAQKESLALAKIVHLTPTAVTAVRRAVLQTEKRAYRISRAYRQTPPATRR